MAVGVVESAAVSAAISSVSVIVTIVTAITAISAVAEAEAQAVWEAGTKAVSAAVIRIAEVRISVIVIAVVGRSRVVDVRRRVGAINAGVGRGGVVAEIGIGAGAAGTLTMPLDGIGEAEFAAAIGSISCWRRRAAKRGLSRGGGGRGAAGARLHRHRGSQIYRDHRHPDRQPEGPERLIGVDRRTDVRHRRDRQSGRGDEVGEDRPFGDLDDGSHPRSRIHGRARDLDRSGVRFSARRLRFQRLVRGPSKNQTRRRTPTSRARRSASSTPISTCAASRAPMCWRWTTPRPIAPRRRRSPTPSPRPISPISSTPNSRRPGAPPAGCKAASPT